MPGDPRASCDVPKFGPVDAGVPSRRCIGSPWAPETCCPGPPHQPPGLDELCLGHWLSKIDHASMACVVGGRSPGARVLPRQHRPWPTPGQHRCASTRAARGRNNKRGRGIDHCQWCHRRGHTPRRRCHHREPGSCARPELIDVTAHTRLREAHHVDNDKRVGVTGCPKVDAMCWHQAGIQAYSLDTTVNR